MHLTAQSSEVNMVVFVGDTPSKLNKSQEVAFVGARCYPILLKWIDLMKIQNYKLTNSHKLELLKETQKMYKNGFKVVALGNMASSRLEALEIEHFKLPHPSPKNLLTNDKYFIIEKLKECKNWIGA